MSFMLSVIIKAIVPSVVMPNAIMLSVMAPYCLLIKCTLSLSHKKYRADLNGVLVSGWHACSVYCNIGVQGKQPTCRDSALVSSTLT